MCRPHWAALFVIAVWAVVAAPDVGALGTDVGSGYLTTKLHRDLEQVRPWLQRYGMGAVFGAVFLEGVGIPAPGLTLVVAGTILSAPRNGPPLGLLAAAFAAAVLGNSLGYLAGRIGGRPLLRRFHVDDERLGRLERVFSRYGGWFVLAARFFDGLKQLNGVAAGVLGMSWRVFSVFNVAGAALWVSLFGLGTYYLDEHLHDVRRLLRHANLWVALGTIALTLLTVWFLKRKGRPAVRGS